jgi:hypothetical protein
MPEALTRACAGMNTQRQGVYLDVRSLAPEAPQHRLVLLRARLELHHLIALAVLVLCEIIAHYPLPLRLVVRAQHSQDGVQHSIGCGQMRRHGEV